MTRAELDDLMLAVVDDPELETRCTLVASDYRITAEDDTGVGPREAGEHEAGRQPEREQPYERFKRYDEVRLPGRRRDVAVSDRRERVYAEEEGLGERHQGRRWLEAVQRLRPEGEIGGRERRVGEDVSDRGQTEE